MDIRQNLCVTRAIVSLHFIFTLADAFVQSNLQSGHSYTDGGGCHARSRPAVWGSASCQRKLQHADQENWTSDLSITRHWLYNSPGLLGWNILSFLKTERNEETKKCLHHISLIVELWVRASASCLMPSTVNWLLINLQINTEQGRSEQLMSDQGTRQVSFMVLWPWVCFPYQRWLKPVFAWTNSAKCGAASSVNSFCTSLQQTHTHTHTREKSSVLEH